MPNEHDPAVLAERLAALDRLVQISFQNAEKALDKASTAMEKRFDGVNEFRSALSDQQQTFLTRDQFGTFSELSTKDRANLHDLCQELRVSQKDFVTLSAMDTEIGALQNQITLLQGSVSRMLITLLSSLVLTVVGALLWDLAHR